MPYESKWDLSQRAKLKRKNPKKNQAAAYHNPQKILLLEIVLRKKKIYEGEEVPRKPVGPLPGPGQEIIDAEIITKPRQLRGDKKALPKPAPRAIEAPGTGPFVAEPAINLDYGPDFGKTVYQITKAKKPRQFEGY